MRPRLAGSTDVVDRDRQRLEHDLATREPDHRETRSKAFRWFRTRIAPGRHSPA